MGRAADLVRGIEFRLSRQPGYQRLLQRRVESRQFLMGIGSGSAVDSSGEEVLFQILIDSIAPPYCIFDVGSNQGLYLEAVANALDGLDFSVHCFEPGASTFDRLLNSQEAKRTGVVLNNTALGAEPGECTLYYNQPGSGLACLTKRRLDHFGIAFDLSEPVCVDTVDDYCSRTGVDRIDLLKCDVEGHELDVFKGAQRMFENGRIRMATFEFGGCNIDTRTYFQDFFYFFAQVGMRISRITPAGRLHPIDAYCEIEEQFRTTNFVAFGPRPA
jgi:FkbM family methyltransferase